MKDSKLRIIYTTTMHPKEKVDFLNSRIGFKKVRDIIDKMGEAQNKK